VRGLMKEDELLLDDPTCPAMDMCHVFEHGLAGVMVRAK